MTSIGAKHIGERDDGIEIEGSTTLKGGPVEVHGDHRIAMAAAVAGLKCTGGVSIDNAQVADVSFPGFFDLLEELRA